MSRGTKSKGTRIIAKKTLFREELLKYMKKSQVDLVMADAADRLDKLYADYAGLPKGERMHPYDYIFPSAAIYLAMKDAVPDHAYKIMETAMREKASAAGASLRKMSKLPGFSRFFLRMWDPVSHKMFGPGAGFKNVFYPAEKDRYRMDIVACPYHRYLTELGCPELTILFCKNDEYMYGNLHGLTFTRTQTLGGGGDRCDFCLTIDRD